MHKIQEIVSVCGCVYDAKLPVSAVNSRTLNNHAAICKPLFVSVCAWSYTRVCLSSVYFRLYSEKQANKHRSSTYREPIHHCYIYPHCITSAQLPSPSSKHHCVYPEAQKPVWQMPFKCSPCTQQKNVQYLVGGVALLLPRVPMTCEQ